MLFIRGDNCFYITEQTIGFKTNLNNNAQRKDIMFMNSWFESVFSFILLEIPTLNILLLLLYCQVFQKCIIVISFI